MPIASGIYIITNAQQGNPVFLESPDDEVPLQGYSKPENDSEGWHWRVIDWKNGRHSIQNVKYKRYANCGSRAGLKAHVRGDDKDQEWLIQESRCKGEYTITATDTRNVWMLPDPEDGTPVELFNTPTDRRCWWTFTNLDTGAPVNGDAANPAFLFELKPLPILPFSPLRLDFVVIQKIAENSISDASRTIAAICARLVSLRRVQCDALCVNIIEVTSVRSDIFFKRSYNVVTFEQLRNLGDLHISCKEHGGVSSLPDMAIRSLRPNTTKVVILNLNFALLQQGGQAIVKLINRLVEHDITLILTPIRPTWENAFFDSDVSKELKKLSSERYWRFAHEGEFSDYVINYNEMVALPRISKSPDLWNTIRQNIPDIIQVLKGENRDARSAAVAAFSQLAEYAGLRDTIFQTMPKINEMLKGNGGEAEAAASALIKLAEHAGLRPMICQAIPHMVEILKDENHDGGSPVVEMLSKFAEYTELHDVIFPAVLKTIERLKGPGSGPNIFERVELREVGPNFSDKSGRTSLAWAAASGHYAFVHILLAQKGVDANCKDENGWTPLSLAAQNDHDAVVRLLLVQEGVEANSKDNRDRTPLSLAAENGHDAVVRLLLAQEGVEANSIGWDCRTPLSWAAENGHDEVLKTATTQLYAQESVEANSKDNDYGRTPLSWAAENGHDAVVRLLLVQEDVVTNSKDNDYGRTPLSWAAENSHDAVVRLLLVQEGLNANSKDNRGRTPLLLAASNGHDTVVILLLAQEGVVTNSKDDDYGRTPLSWAAENGHAAVVRLLLAQEGMEANSKGWDRRTPLSFAASNGHDAVVRLLLVQEGMEANSKDNRGRTPLLLAASNGHDAVVRLLLAQEGVDANSKDNRGRTPLLLAASNGHNAVVRLLLVQEGVDANSKDRYGRTPRSLATANGHAAVVRLLPDPKHAKSRLRAFFNHRNKP